MQNDCEIYVDSEEDEVFFGCMSERERNVYSKIVNCAESSSKNCKFNRVTNNLSNINEENINNTLKKEQSTKVSEEVTITNDPSKSVMLEDEENSLERSDDSVTILSNNTSVELDHSYSTPMKHKIDKTILTTPKSVVKADRDGGFLKVLSEIALVKAEAEADKESEEEEEEEKKKKKKKKEDEDKENKIVQPVPEIKVTEATPEKVSVLSSPKSFKTNMRRFRIIYNSPQNEDNVDHKSKSHSEDFENERNLRNKYLDQEVAKCPSGEKRKSLDLIDFNESNVLNKNVLVEAEESDHVTEQIERNSQKNSSSDSDEVVVLEEEKRAGESLEGIQKEVEGEGSTSADGKPPEIVPVVEKTPVPAPRGVRFSREARKVVEVLKKSAADDTLNFTIPEMDLESEENIFLSPEPLAGFDDTIVPSKDVVAASPVIVRENRLEVKSRTVEKERGKLTPVASRSRLQPLKYFSERKLNKQVVGSEAVRFARKLPMENRRAAATMEKANGGGGGDCGAVVPMSRIPVFGSKNLKIPVNDRVAARPLKSKSTPSKTPSGKGCKNPRFNHIESPINAYIHNKPTSLVQNVRPEVRKDNMAKVWKAQTTGSATRLQEKTTAASGVRLPFVEYKSATPYKIEKRSESRLPRLAPTVMKLLSPHSPKVLKHEGRFYLKTPKQNSSENSTIVAEPNEVSVVVSHPAQKSRTFK